MDDSCRVIELTLGTSIAAIKIGLLFISKSGTFFFVRFCWCSVFIRWFCSLPFSRFSHSIPLSFLFHFLLPVFYGPVSLVIFSFSVCPRRCALFCVLFTSPLFSFSCFLLMLPSLFFLFLLFLFPFFFFSFFPLFPFSSFSFYSLLCILFTFSFFVFILFFFFFPLVLSLMIFALRVLLFLET